MEEKQVDPQIDQLRNQYYRLKVSILQRLAVGLVGSAILLFVLYVVVDPENLGILYLLLGVSLLPLIMVRLVTNREKMTIFETIPDDVQKTLEKEDRVKSTEVLGKGLVIITIMFLGLIAYTFYLNFNKFEINRSDPLHLFQDLIIPYDLLVFTFGIVLLLVGIVNWRLRSHFRKLSEYSS